MRIMDFFESDSKVLLRIKETNEGVLTFMNPDLKKMGGAYRTQIIEFLNGAIKELKVK